LKEEREKKRFCYSNRIESLNGSDLDVLAVLLQASVSDNLNLRRNILPRKLIATGIMSQEAASRFFKGVLRKGVLSSAT